MAISQFSTFIFTVSLWVCLGKIYHSTLTLVQQSSYHLDARDTRSSLNPVFLFFFSLSIISCVISGIVMARRWSDWEGKIEMIEEMGRVSCRCIIFESWKMKIMLDDRKVEVREEKSKWSRPETIKKNLEQDIQYQWDISIIGGAQVCGKVVLLNVVLQLLFKIANDLMDLEKGKTLRM